MVDDEELARGDGGMPVALFDASVLYPNFLRDILMRVATADLVQARWTDEIHDEWTRNVLADRPDLPPAAIYRTRALMNAALPNAHVTNYEALARLFPGVHRKDRHVAAAALMARQQAERSHALIVTNNMKDFPTEALATMGLEAISGDELLARLATEDLETLRNTLEVHRESLRRPPLTSDEYRDWFVHGGLITAADMLWPTATEVAPVMGDKLASQIGC